MSLWILIIVGLLLFTFGLYSLIQNKKAGKFIAAYEHCTYWGLATAVLGVILLMEPILSTLQSTISRVVPIAIVFFIMLTVNSFLKSTFRNQINNNKSNKRRK